MGTLSKRGIEEFGDDIKEHIDDLRTRVGRKLDAGAAGSSLDEAGSNFGRTLEAEASRGPQSDDEKVRSAQLVDENGNEIGHEKPRTAAGTANLGAPASGANQGSVRGRLPVADRFPSRPSRRSSDRSSQSTVSMRSKSGAIPVSDQSDLDAVSRGIKKPELRSGFAHQVERVMAGVPTATWITLAGASLVGSFGLRLFGRRALANLFSGWAPMFLVAGLYNKLTTVGAATALLSSRR